MSCSLNSLKVGYIGEYSGSLDYSSCAYGFGFHECMRCWMQGLGIPMGMSQDNVYILPESPIIPIHPSGSLFSNSHIGICGYINTQSGRGRLRGWES